MCVYPQFDSQPAELWGACCSPYMSLHFRTVLSNKGFKYHLKNKYTENKTDVKRSLSLCSDISVCTTVVHWPAFPPVKATEYEAPGFDAVEQSCGFSAIMIISYSHSCCLSCKTLSKPSFTATSTSQSSSLGDTCKVEIWPQDAAEWNYNEMTAEVWWERCFQKTDCRGSGSAKNTGSDPAYLWNASDLDVFQGASVTLKHDSVSFKFFSRVAGW